MKNNSSSSTQSSSSSSSSSGVFHHSHDSASVFHSDNEYRSRLDRVIRWIWFDLLGNSSDSMPSSSSLQQGHYSPTTTITTTTTTATTKSQSSALTGISQGTSTTNHHVYRFADNVDVDKLMRTFGAEYTVIRKETSQNGIHHEAEPHRSIHIAQLFAEDFNHSLPDSCTSAPSTTTTLATTTPATHDQDNNVEEQSEDSDDDDDIDAFKLLVDPNFVLRRPRKPTQRALRETERNIIEKIKQPEKLWTFEIFHTPSKGRSVRTLRPIPMGHFVCEYRGELISNETALDREDLYTNDPNLCDKCYMYYFKHKGVRMCVDATAPSETVGRLINHSSTQHNLFTRKFVVNRSPRLAFIAERDIAAHEELLYDYGDRDLDTIKSFPWLDVEDAFNKLSSRN